MPLFSPLRYLVKTKFFCCLASILCINSTCFARIQPAEGSVLNCTQVMFEYDEIPAANNYKLVITSAGNSLPFSREIKNRSLACIISGLGFGGNYSWYYEAYNKKKLIYTSDVYHFSVSNHYLVDPNLYKTIIGTSKARAFDNDIIFLDHLGVAIDRKGTPVWYYSSTPTDGSIEPNFRNMRMTNNGTITFQDNDNCYEIDLAGRVLWKAPNDGKISGDKREFYHHDFRKLNDGNYLTASYQYVRQPNIFNPAIMANIRYNTLIEYDVSGKVIWSWNEKDHIPVNVLFEGYDTSSTEVEGTHLNGFDYDPGENAIVMSFRNNSSIIRIDKKTGDIVYNISRMGSRRGTQQLLFQRQHGPFFLPGHRLLIYNNHVSDTMTVPTFPKVMMLQEPLDGRPLQSVWEFECRSDSFPKGITGKEGYASPLPNGNILVAMGGANFSFEVTPKKEIVWEAYFEKFDREKKEWTGFNNYRCTAASSLYPRYFTLQHITPDGIRINNEGTDGDKYIVEGFEPGGRTKIFSDTISVKPRSSATVIIKKELAMHNMTVVVTPCSDPLMSKYIELKNLNQNR